MNRIKWIGIVRIVGLCLVLIYHFFNKHLPGGFIGVDVFFVFSGYLITALAVSETQRKGGFSLGGFFKRRCARIYPPFILAICLVLPFTMLISADFRAGLIRQIAAALGFVTNFYEIQTGGSYEAKLLPHLFVHTWSLAVEVQLYIAWAFVIKLLSAAASARPRAFKALLFIFSLGLAAASFMYMQNIYTEGMTDPSPAYFNTLSRSFPFFIGSAAGALFGVDIKEATKKALSGKDVVTAGLIAAVCGAAGLIILAVNLTFTTAATYRYGILLASLFAVVLIYALRVLHEATPDDIIEPKIITGFADLSYCIFLTHWPLFIVFSNIRAINGDFTVFAAGFGVSLALSVFIFYFAEPLIRDFGKKEKREAARVRYAVLAFVFLFAFGLSVNTAATAPSVSSLDNEMNVGFMYQDSDSLYDIKRDGDSVNTPPILLAFPDTNDSFLYWVNDYDTVTAYYVPPAPEQEQPPDGQDPEDTAEPADNPEPEETPEPEPEEPRGAETVTIGQPRPASPADTPPALPPAPMRPAVVRPNRELNEAGIPKGVYVIGDSVALGARQALLDTIPDSEVDAAQNRQMWQGHEEILYLQEQELLPEYVVIALGTNVNHNALDRVDAIIRDINPGHRLVFVTPYNGRVAADSLTNHTAAHIRNLPELYPFVSVADWAGVIGPQDHIIGADRCHIGGNRAAIAIYVELIMNALAEAAEKPAAGEEPDGGDNGTVQTEAPQGINIPSDLDPGF